MNKYRAYDKLEKQMRRVVSLHWQNDTLVAVKVEGEAEPLPIEGRFIIEQYTCHMDKNKKHVAVGDIIRSHYANTLHGDLTNEYIVIYSEYHSAPRLRLVETPEYSKMSDDFSYPHTKDMEVIGNIHENAELLEEK